MSRVFAVASGKGGVGKSVITANLAAAVAQNGIRVLVIDADIGLRSQDALLSLENRVVYDLVDLSRGDCLPDQAILASEQVPSLHLLPAAQFERVKSLSAEKFRKLISSLRNRYEYIFIDCPAGIERGLRTVLKAGVDDIVLIVTPDDISVRSAERAAQVIEEKNGPRPYLIVNRLNRDLVRSGEMMSAQTVSQVLDYPLLGVVPEDSVVCRALLRHALFINYNCEARDAVLRISSRIRGSNVPLPGSGKRIKNRWFRNLFSGSLKEVAPLDDH